MRKRQTGWPPVVIFLTFTLWALILTYPLILHPFSHIPRGDENAGTVPLFNLWTLQWNIDQLTRGYPNYWDAPIFAPLDGTFAFSETQPLSALLAAPLWLGLQSPAFGYNAVVILFLTLNGWFAFWLLKNWRVTPRPAFLAGLLVQSLPFVAQEMGVLQLVALFGILWSLLFLTRFMAQSRRGQSGWRNVVGLALGTPVTFFTCGYYGLFSLFFLPLFFVTQLRPHHFRPAVVTQLLAAGLLVAGLSGPFLLAQQHHLARHGFARSERTIKNNSARPKDYAHFLDHNLLYGQLLGLESGRGQRLFPGLGLMALAGLGLIGRRPKRVKLYLGGAVLLAVLLSVGLRLQIGSFQPYQWVRVAIPGFLQLRSPFRFAALAQLHLALLAGFGLLNLRRWSPRIGPVVVGPVAALAIFELLALPLPLQPVPAAPAPAPWQAWLNQQQPAAQIVMLPFAQSHRVADFEQTARWMLANRHVQGRMVNGYSGFFPQNHARLREQMLRFPTAEGINMLGEMGVDYVIIYHNLANAPPARVVARHLPQLYVDPQSNVAIYAVER